MGDLAIFDSAQTDLFDGDRFAAGYSLPGFTEVDKAWLVGIPHRITCVTYWVPKMGFGHVSLECVVGNARMIERAMRKNKVPDSALGNDGHPLVDAEEAIVYSDGGTGVRRQVTAILNTFGLINVGDGPDEGKMGESRFDRPWTEWQHIGKSTRGQGDVQVPSIRTNHAGEPLGINVNGGLIDSDYTNDSGIEGKTYYLR